jgi:hypothetical protein
MKATTLLIGSTILNLLVAVHGFGADPVKVGPPGAAPSPHVYTLDNVVIDRFQARDATLSDVLEALSVLSYNATDHRYRPTFVVIGTVASARPVNLNLSRSSLSNAIALLAEDSGLLVTHRQGSVIFSARE